jgi:peroxiredoxin
LKGDIVVLNFFAIWCGPCLSELPRLEKEVWQAHRGDGFKLFAIGREHTAAELNAFRKEHGFTFSLAEDPERDTYSRFAEKTIPRTYVIDRDGTILYQSKGYDPAEFTRMVAVINDALKTDSESAEPQASTPGNDVAGEPSKLKSVTVSGETRIRVQHWER